MSARILVGTGRCSEPEMDGVGVDVSDGLMSLKVLF